MHNVVLYSTGTQNVHRPFQKSICKILKTNFSPKLQLLSLWIIKIRVYDFKGTVYIWRNVFFLPGIMALCNTSYRKYNEIQICSGQDHGKWMNLKAFWRFGQSTEIKFITSDSVNEENIVIRI